MFEFRDKTVYNRAMNYIIICSVLFFALIGRLYWVQIKEHELLGIQAIRQRGKEINLIPNRGIIYDRNLIPLTNTKKLTSLYVFKDKIMEDLELQRFIYDNTYLTRVDIGRLIDGGKEIIEIPLRSSTANRKLDRKSMLIEKVQRYNDGGILSHVIGYTNKSENRGETGIEGLYDDVLNKNASENILIVELDEKQKVFLDGSHTINKKIDSAEPNGVKLTVDFHIQAIVENILDKRGVKGAIIVADIDSGEIRALASRPNFNQEEVEDYLNRDDMALYNKAVQVAYPPGSLFKMVVLLTALEKDSGFLNAGFYCKGYEELGNIKIKCNKEDGHGHIGLKDAFLESCNSAFIQLGKELGSIEIIDMAGKLGFGRRINIGLIEEIGGNLPQGNDLKGPAIGNISIGQGDIEVTPMQVTNLMLIVANGGIDKGLSIVEGITSEDGHIIKQYKKKTPERALSERNCQILKEYLVEVVEKGTARNIDLEDIGGAGGKTGSAQAILNRKETTHGWFSGFYPKKEPRYVLTVLVEEGISGAKTAAPIFEELIREIYKINR